MKVLEQKQKMGGVNASKENDAMIGRQIRTLENRLEKVLTKFNESLAEVSKQHMCRSLNYYSRLGLGDADSLLLLHLLLLDLLVLLLLCWWVVSWCLSYQNKSLREQIDHLRIDRVVFDNVYKRLERSLHEKKKEMAAIVEDSKVACQLRDKARSELTNIKQQAEVAKLEFEVRRL